MLYMFICFICSLYNIYNNNIKKYANEIRSHDPSLTYTLLNMRYSEQYMQCVNILL